VNPVTVHRQQPPGEPIQSVHRAAFLEARDDVLRRLSGTLLAGTAARKPDAVRASQ
jgi:hypothetical protein